MAYTYSSSQLGFRVHCASKAMLADVTMFSSRAKVPTDNTVSSMVHVLSVTPTRSAGYQQSLWENTSRPRGAWSNTALAATGSLSPVALGYMSLLALQFGLQPILTRAFAPKTICRSTVVMMQEVTKFIASAVLLYTGGNWSAAFASWSVKTWTLMAGIPAGLYVVQNYCALIAYQHLTPVTFNVLNQTKTLSAALFCFLIMGRMQSKLQILALVILAMAALVLEKIVPLPWKLGLGTTVGSVDDQASDREHFTSGVFPILAASGISGLAGVSAQTTLNECNGHVDSKLPNLKLFTLPQSGSLSKDATGRAQFFPFDDGDQ